MSFKEIRTAAAADHGLTLVELLVATVLLGILGTLVTFGVVTSHEQFRVTDDESTGLADSRVVVERLGRDIRVARGVDAGADVDQLVLWIDYNSDYVRNDVSQPEEIVTWSVVDNGSGQYNTLRQTAAGEVQYQARTLVSNLAFCYQSEPDAACLDWPLSAADAEAARLITVTLQYDSKVGTATESRTTVFSERMRNVD